MSIIRSEPRSSAVRRRMNSPLRRVAFERLEARYLFAGDVAAVAPAAVEGEGTGVIADFSLVDANVNSASFGQNISPRDYLQQVSAYYFGYGL